jgi:hypothetical protein
MSLPILPFKSEPHLITFSTLLYVSGSSVISKVMDLSL